MSDSDGWMNLGTLAVAIVSAAGGGIVAVIGYLMAGYKSAEEGGEADGILKEWRRTVETRMQENSVSIRDVEGRINNRFDVMGGSIGLAIREMESRLNARMDSSDIRQLRQEERSEQYALRSDMMAGFDRIEAALRNISEWIHTKPR